MLCACGGDSSTSTVTVVDSDGIPTIAAGEKLLKADCNKSTIGSFVYVEDSLLIFHCTEWGWRAYTGRDGKEGKAGANGKDGEDGQNGNDGMDGDSCSIDSYANGFAVVCQAPLRDHDARYLRYLFCEPVGIQCDLWRKIRKAKSGCCRPCRPWLLHARPP